GSDLSRLQPGHEPARALLRRAMGERVRDDVALGTALQTIVADGGCRLHRRLDVAWLDDTPLLLCVVGPDAGKAVGLQLDPNLEVIGLRLIQASLHLLNLGQDSQQILHMMPDLVRDHVGLRELAAPAADVAAAKAPLKVLKEFGIEIDLSVVGAV